MKDEINLNINIQFVYVLMIIMCFMKLTQMTQRHLVSEITCNSLRETFLRSRKEENLYGHCATCITARPYDSVKKINGWPPRDAPSELVQLWYKTFPCDHNGQLEIKKPN